MPHSLNAISFGVLVFAFLLAIVSEIHFRTAPGRRRKRIQNELQNIACSNYCLCGKFGPIIRAKAEYALWKGDEQTQKNYVALLMKEVALASVGAPFLPEEDGPRVRAYLSEIDHTLQTYSLSLPKAYLPSSSKQPVAEIEERWPLIVQMHGHGWYGPFQGHPAPVYTGAFCLSPQGRGATDYKELGELDVMHVIDLVCKEYPIDENRIYLMGSSMGGTGAFHLGTHYADRFAAILPVAANADHLAWTKRWLWNRDFPGRFTALRDWIQDGQSARTFAENLLSLPTYIIAGSGDTVVPPEHSRAMAKILRSVKANYQYREYPNAGHGGFPDNAVADGFGWICSWERNPYPNRIYWKANLLKHGKAYWTRMEQFEQPLKTGVLSAVFQKNTLTVQTSNLLAFSFQRPPQVFGTGDFSVVVDGQSVSLRIVPPAWDHWLTLRKSPVHGWVDASAVPAPDLVKKAGVEGPISEAFTAPFLVVVGSSSQNAAMNKAWLREGERFAQEWKRRNGAPCRVKLDQDCTQEDLEQFNLILFGGESDNSVSAVLARDFPLQEIMAVLPAKNDDPVGKNDALFASDFGSIVLYPNIECSPDHLVVLCTANGPDAAFQFWQRFGNWFNWGVFDNSKYFDYCVYDARSHSPETMLLIGWYGTDWSVENGVYYLGEEALRAEAGLQCYPPLDELPNNRNDLLLAELQPSLIDQMRGAVNFGRGYSGERLALPGSIGVRAPSVLEYDIGGRYKTFQAGVHLMNSPEHGIPDIRRYYETVSFELFGDGKLLCQRKLTWNETVGRMEVKIKGVKKLTLKLSCSGGPSWLHSEAAWISPRLSVE